MQIQRTNNSFMHAPRFEANKLNTITIAAKNLTKQNIVDIYSINKNDQILINELISKITLSERNDKSAIAEKTIVNDAINYAFQKAGRLGEKDSESCIIAVENKNKVVGILYYLCNDVPFLKNLIVWDAKNNQIIRTTLLKHFLSKAERINRNRHCSNYKNAVAFADFGSPGSLLLNKFGFKKQKMDVNSPRVKMEIKAQYLKDAVKAAEQKLLKTGSVDIKTYLKPEKVTLENIEI